MPSTCIIYLRVSTAEQAAPGHHSLDAQEILCRRYADAQRIEVVEVIRDEGYSGRTTRRPGLRRLLEYTSAKPPVRVDVILVQDTSRMSRDTTEYLLFRRDLRHRNIELVAVTQPNIDSSPEGRLVDTIMAGINQYQSEEKGRRVSIAMQKKFEEGCWPSKAPLGYRNAVHDGKHSIEADPDRFSLLQLGFREYATGRYTQQQLREFLTEKGLRDAAGRPLTHGSLNKLLTKPFYFGLMRWDGQERMGRHPPLTDRQTWENCQAVTAMHNHYVSRQRKHVFLLAGLTTCAVCRHRHTHSVIHKKRKRYYHCPGRVRCAQPYVPEGILEDQVAAYIQGIKLSEAFITAVIEQIQAVFTKKAEIIERKKALLLRQQTLAEQKRTAAEQKLLAGVLTDEAFRRIIPLIAAELDDVARQLKSLESARRLDSTVLREVLLTAKDIPGTYARATPFMKRRYIDFFFTEFIVRDRQIVQAIPTEFFRTLVEFQRVRTDQNWQPSVNANRTVEWYDRFSSWLSEQLVLLKGLSPTEQGGSVGSNHA